MTSTSTRLHTPTIEITIDPHNVAVVTLNDPNQRTNTMNAAFRASLSAAIDYLHERRTVISGVVVTSAKRTFFAGGDLHDILAYAPADADRVQAETEQIKSDLRRLETLGKPVVAAINGAALGGGLELALACHHRIAIDDPRTLIGLPEATLGLLPGGGGIVRTVRLLGIDAALDSVLLPGKRFSPSAARERGLIDAVVAEVGDLIPAAKAWIATHPEATQPWDRPGFTTPGGTMADVGYAATVGQRVGRLRAQLNGAPYPAPRAIVAAAIEGAHLSFDAASDIETRYFVELAVGAIAKNLISANFLDMARVRSGAARPSGQPTFSARRIGVIGAGMMGAGIAYVAAKNGLEVALMDLSLEAAERGKNYSRRLVAKTVSRGGDEDHGNALLDRITTVSTFDDLAGSDLVIEAVFEDPDLKRATFAELQDRFPEVLLASNTSTLPIAELAQDLARPDRLIGMHFFSPVDKMELLELVVAEHTSAASTAQAFDIALQLGKTPIVVNDSRGFFTSRVIGKYLDEAVAMLGEGIAAASIEQAALQAGYPVGPLQLLDETSFSLPRKVRKETRAATEASGRPWTVHPAEPIMDELIDRYGRDGRAAGGGFYAYEGGQRCRLWPGLTDLFGGGTEIPFADIKERLLFSESLEALRCMREGVICSTADANVGSILGIGYPRWTGGVVQYAGSYPGGAEGFIRRADDLAARYGERFAAPQGLDEIINADG
jgi:3-hydroxyacyl-CoA dehydrogenase/enoyl-CoA hydratase/3-hydroxybutyryl-CoA epimerase